MTQPGDEMTDSMPSEESLGEAARIWCEPSCERKTMDVELANQFAWTLDRYKKKLESERAKLEAERQKAKGLVEALDLSLDAIERITFHMDISPISHLIGVPTLKDRFIKGEKALAAYRPERPEAGTTAIELDADINRLAEKMNATDTTGEGK